MGKVVAMPITLSDRGKALCAIEAERQELYAKAKRIATEQQQIIQTAAENVAQLGKEHQLILDKLVALDDAANKIVGDYS